tara:strand:+ start:1936 stop:3471 length:1536 start_codon:yes stop_codon:yes gene_type:complete
MSNTIEFEVLRKEIISDSEPYPIFVGFLSAEKIFKVSEAPSFTDSTGNEKIASKVNSPPFKDWQRPINNSRVEQIKLTYNDSGEIMPNPVLLCENVVDATSSDIKIELTRGKYHAKIKVPSTGSPLPLWILDGQHRIAGLSKSRQKDNHIPVVLLCGEGSPIYKADLLAKIFAQVTTEATALDAWHNEWLTYAFKLKKYADDAPHVDEMRQSMETVVFLCKEHNLAGEQNYFFDKIKFNNHLKPDRWPTCGGFKNDCIEFPKLIYQNYFKKASSHGHLAPKKIAENISLGLMALKTLVTGDHDKSVFFGESQYEQKIMQDAYIAGILSYLLDHGEQDLSKWTALLKKLKFDLNDWNFHDWIQTLNGSSGSNSRKMAIKIFQSIFKNKDLPTGVNFIHDYMRGDGAKIELSWFEPTPAGKGNKRTQHKEEITPGRKQSYHLGAKLFVKVTSKDNNISKLQLLDGKGPSGEEEHFSEKGFLIDRASRSSPLTLKILMESYGGLSDSSECTLKW